MEKSEIQEGRFEFPSTVPQGFVCPISNIVMQDPYMDDNGISYQKQVIFQWVTRTGRHPTVSRIMKLQQLKANQMLKEVIKKYKNQHQNIGIPQKPIIETNSLCQQGAAKLQSDQFKDSDSGYEDSQKKHKEKILGLEQIIEAKQRQLQKNRNSVMHSSIKLREQIIQVKKLEQAVEKSKMREQQLSKTIQQLSQKNRNLESENQSLKRHVKNLINQLFQDQSKQQQKKENSTYEQTFNNNIGQKTQTNISQTRTINITPDTKTYAWENNGYQLDSQNENACVCCSGWQWLCSSDLGTEGQFVFTIRLKKVSVQFGRSLIMIGVMESEKKGHKWDDTSKNCVYLSIRYQSINRPNEEQTKQQAFDLQCQSIAQLPCEVQCHVNREQNTIEWHYNGKQQAKSKMPQLWKQKRNQLCAIVNLWNKGDTVEFM